MPRILFVEDDKGYRDNLVNVLESHGYDVEAAENAIHAIELFPDYEYDLILSDLQMDGMDGVRFLKYIKKVKPEMKTIILTGAATSDSEYEALELDVDQYLDKDVRMDVLLKYIERVLNKNNNLRIVRDKEKILKSELEDLVVNVNRREVFCKGEKVYLTEKEFQILCYMLENKGFALSRDDFINEIWENQIEEVDPRAVDSHVKALRRKIQTVSIASIRGYGYKWSE